MLGEELVKKYCPIFYLHSKEPFFPSPWEEIIKMTTLYDNDKVSISNEKLKKNVNLVISEKHNLQVDKNQDRNRFNLKLTHIKKEGHFDKPEIQAFITDIIQYKDQKFINIKYSLFYAYNGTLDPHLRDIESMIIRLRIDNRTGDKFENYNYINPRIEKIYLSAHSGGKWFDEKHFDKEENRIIVYIANESHAYYPKPKIYRRFFRFGDDNCEKSLKYDPSDNIILLPTIEYKDFMNFYENNLDKQKYFYKGQWEGGAMSVYHNTKGFVNYFDCYSYQGGVSNVIEKEVSPFYLSILKYLIFPLLFFPLFIFSYNLIFRSYKNYSILQYLLSLIFFGGGLLLFFLLFII
jgi:hypothetical protein